MGDRVGGLWDSVQTSSTKKQGKEAELFQN